MSRQLKERILVCVNYGHNGTKLIKRGVTLAKKLDAPLTILVFDALPEEEFKHDKEVDMALFQELAEDAHADLTIEKSRSHDITRVITNKAKEIQATQIMIGQFVESIWTTLLGGSIVNELMEKAPFADLHVVPKTRSEEVEDWNFERGIQAFILQNDKGTYDLQFDDTKGYSYEGIFFKHLQTDFNSGIFSFIQNGRIFEVRVEDGNVYHLVDIDDEEETEDSE